MPVHWASDEIDHCAHYLVVLVGLFLVGLQLVTAG